MDAVDLERKIRRFGPAVGAVIHVHVGGYISNSMSDIVQCCERAGIPLIEDCAHSHGAQREGRAAGSFGKAAIYSFFMTKPLTSGEGGIVTTDDAALARSIEDIRNYGKSDAGVHYRAGFNFRLSELNAAVALWATRNADRILGERRRLASLYDDLLADAPALHRIDVDQSIPSYYKYVVRLADGARRDATRIRLRDRYGIELPGGVYDTPCHREPFFRDLSDRILNAASAFPGSECAASQNICLPLYPGLAPEKVAYVADALREIVTSEQAAAVK
jgi:dTDP-4-amino-4,6-dideoxygalactose transaminase